MPGQNSAIDDPAGHDALTGLEYIGPQATLDLTAGATLGTVRAGDQGDLTTGITIPSSTPAGTHHLVAAGSDGRRAEVAITVT